MPRNSKLGPDQNVAAAQRPARRSRARYRPGPAIRSLPVAVSLIEQGCPLYWIRTDIGPRNARFMAQQRLATLAGSCRAGMVFLAIPVDGADR